ncbi:MAG: hypothetical protein LBH13_01730 [Cellulomonadaceae bacterium]|nr:hypothetical protein [Cellulomonadaceae bacterium]
MTEITQAGRIQQEFEAGGLPAVFTHLGWDKPNGNTGTIQSMDIDGITMGPSRIAHLKGFGIWTITSDSRPTRAQMRRVDTQLSVLSPERLAIFQCPDAWLWHWPIRTAAGTTRFESVETRAGVLPTYLAQRLTGLRFTVADHMKGITLTAIREKVHGHFDATNVTKKFYKRFQNEHKQLADAIRGVPTEDEANYATTLLNRLMFLYFLQKKEFLNGDPQYLENTFAKVREASGPGKVYTFFRDALLPLFFLKLDDRDGVIEDPVIARIIGSVPYVNGGIFGQTDVEGQFGEHISIPDEAFERILGFFSEFNWHLDTRPTGNDKEINPEVIGYIFEQYINFTASGKKDNGAYYTPHDVTAYMVGQTLVPRILDDFRGLDGVFKLLRSDPDRYIQPAMLHGFGWRDDDTEKVVSEWIEAPAALVECWEGDPIGWPLLDDADHNPEINLPGETWVETFHRRERVESLRNRIAQGELNEVNHIITDNINAQLLLTDAIDEMTDAGAVAALFNSITGLSVFDPTCGSGAFLFAALEVLEDVYAHIIDRARTLGSMAVSELLAQVDAHPSVRYFIRKHIAIRNLYGTDIMTGAIETAKLRIFLALAACVDLRSELQPLPDLDFNLKVGNLVVGFKDADDALRLGGNVLVQNQLVDLQPKVRAHGDLYREFQASVESDDPEAASLKEQLRQSSRALRTECDDIYATLSNVATDPAERAAWSEQTKPFHWFCEFPEIIESGGFDVVIGNPPYITMSGKQQAQLALRRQSEGYKTAKCPDFYAVCYERSISLTDVRGRHALVVMLNLACGAKFGELRRVIGDRFGAEWWSSFGKWPTQLFAGVRMANTILITGNVRAPTGNNRTIQVAKHGIFGYQQRSYLFGCMEYHSSRRPNGDGVIRGGLAADLLHFANALPAVGGIPGPESVFVKNVGQYWFPLLLTNPPVLTDGGEVDQDFDPENRIIRLGSDESRLIVAGVLAGKIGYAWWSAVGDDYNVQANHAGLGRRVALEAAKASGKSRLTELASLAMRSGASNAFVSDNLKKKINVRWANARVATDAFDRAVLEALGQIGQWRNLNIWYRQCMRATRANNNSRLLTQDEIDRYLPW